MKKLAILLLGLTLICANTGYAMEDFQEEDANTKMTQTPAGKSMSDTLLKD